MMTRSIVGRFLMLAVLLVSLGVIAQAALIITRGPGKAIAKANAAPLAAPTPAVASAAPSPAAPQAATPDAPAQQAVQPADAAPVRVVYPGPLGDTPVQPRKFAAAAPSVPSAPQPAPNVPVTQGAVPIVGTPTTPAAAPAVAAVPAPAKPSPVVVASADADTQPVADPPANSAAKGGVNLNSASVDVLNRLGGGHIGQTIVKHRPYGSVEDLVKKRVVRRSVYEQIKNQVAAQ